MSSIDQNTNTTLNNLFIKNFRNIYEANLSFSPTHNLFIGKNGHGKTNCLEAIALSCSLKPMQSLQNIDLIHNQCHQAKIMADFSSSISVDLDIFSAGKKAKMNGQALKNAAKLIDFLPLVSFIPMELNMIQGSASLRRRALDQAASSLFLEHLLALKAYDKLLLHRNRLLKDGAKDQDSLDVFTTLLLEEGAKVMFFRLSALEKIQTHFLEQLAKILGPSFFGEISYWQDEPIKNFGLLDLKARLFDQYKKLSSQEFKRRCTLFGPHLDDVVFTIDNMDAKKFSSRGQARALVLSFKLAHMMSVQSQKGRAPIIILDDIVSELDHERKLNLMNALEEIKAQSFFSATDLTTFGASGDFKIFNLNNGHIS